MAQTKKPRKKRQALTQAQLCALHPVGQARLMSLLRQELNSLRSTVALQIAWGDNSVEIVKKVGRLFLIIGQSAAFQGLQRSTPELRIIESTCSALVEIGERQTQATLERHRASIAAALDAADRVMEKLSIESLAVGFAQYEAAMKNMTRGA